MAARRDPTVDALTVAAYRLGAAGARFTPGPLAEVSATAIGVTLAGVMRSRRTIVERHLRRVDPRLRGVALRRAVQASFDSYARYYIESFRLPTLSRRIVADGLEPRGYEEHLLPALEAGKGAIMAIPHLGGWEWAGRWVADRGHQITVVVEPLHPPELFEWFVGLRRDLGMNVVPLGPDAGAAVLGALRNNHVVCLLCDRDLQRSGVPVTFFGETTTLPAGPATLALRSGAPILPTAIYFTPRVHGHLGVVRPPIPLERHGRLRDDVARITQLLAYELEALIRRAPDQWHMQQPNWPSDPGYYDTVGDEAT
jgi:phosphatidylinositol dimannoside acyltransferase